MTVILSTNELPGRVWFRSYQCDSKEEAEKQAAGRVSYLYHSRVIETMYILYIPVERESA